MMKKIDCFYDEKLARLKSDEFYTKYPHLDEDLIFKIAKHGDLEVFRLLCTALYLAPSQKNSYFSNPMNYSLIRYFRNKCSNRVDKILGDYSSLYENMATSQKHVPWNGNEKYRLFSYGLPPYIQRTLILSLIEMVVLYLNKPLTQQNIAHIISIYNMTHYYDPYPKYTMIDYTMDFNMCNRMVEKETAIWIDIMNYIYNNDYKSAYNVVNAYKKYIINNKGL